MVHYFLTEKSSVAVVVVVAFVIGCVTQQARAATCDGTQDCRLDGPNFVFQAARRACPVEGSTCDAACVASSPKVGAVRGMTQLIIWNDILTAFNHPKYQSSSFGSNALYRGDSGCAKCCNDCCPKSDKEYNNGIKRDHLDRQAEEDTKN